MFLSQTREPDAARDFDAAADRFLRRWAFIRAANMDAFAARNAEWLHLPPPPRLAWLTLAEHGIGITRQVLPPSVRAVWTVDAGAYHVRLSPFLSPGAANFTLWHEWFDILAARPAFPGRPAGWQVERLADRFAACIAMPEPAVREAAATFWDSSDKADVLAARFGVGLTAMRRRLRELNLARPGLD
jgi:hypothetical protein